MSSVDNYPMNPLSISQLSTSKKNLVCSQGNSAATEYVGIRDDIVQNAQEMHSHYIVIKVSTIETIFGKEVFFPTNNDNFQI